MIKKIFLTSIICSGLFITACNPPNQSTTSPTNNTNNSQTDLVTIEGIVNDPNDQPVADVKITVKENDNVLGTTISNGKGEFSIKVPKVFGDSYFVEATKNVSDGNLEQKLLITMGEKANFTGNDKLRKNQIASKPAPIQ